MVSLLPTGLLLTLIALASANPFKSHSLPRTYAALGDSYSSGVGSGQFLKTSSDKLDVQCVRQDGAYPIQLQKLIPFNVYSKHHYNFEFTSCAGDKLDDIDGQVAKLEVLPHKFDLITLTIGGNDFGFGDIADACVYQPLNASIPDPQALCDAAFAGGLAALHDPASWKKYAQKIDLVKSTLLAPGGSLFVTGYGKFFDEPAEGDACDKLSFFPVPGLGALNMTVESRTKANNITDQINFGIQSIINQQRDPAVTFFDFDKSFEGHRFCEKENKEDPIGSNNDAVFFNDLATVLPTPGVAEVSKQTPGLQVDISQVLQQVSVFHPKAQAYEPLVAKFAYKILVGASHAHGVYLGGTKSCRHSWWNILKGTACSGYDIPDACAIVVQKGDVVPIVVCEDGKSFPAQGI